MLVSVEHTNSCTVCGCRYALVIDSGKHVYVVLRATVDGIGLLGLGICRGRWLCGSELQLLCLITRHKYGFETRACVHLRPLHLCLISSGLTYLDLEEEVAQTAASCSEFMHINRQMLMDSTVVPDVKSGSV